MGASGHQWPTPIDLKGDGLMKTYGVKAAGTEESHAQVRRRSAIDGKAYGAHNVMG